MLEPVAKSRHNVKHSKRKMKERKKKLNFRASQWINRKIKLQKKRKRKNVDEIRGSKKTKKYCNSSEYFCCSEGTIVAHHVMLTVTTESVHAKVKACASAGGVAVGADERETRMNRKRTKGSRSDEENVKLLKRKSIHALRLQVVRPNSCSRATGMGHDACKYRTAYAGVASSLSLRGGEKTQKYDDESALVCGQKPLFQINNRERVFIVPCLSYQSVECPKRLHWHFNGCLPTRSKATGQWRDRRRGASFGESRLFSTWEHICSIERAARIGQMDE